MEGQECTYTQHHGIVSGHCQWTNNMTGSAIIYVSLRVAVLALPHRERQYTPVGVQ